MSNRQFDPNELNDIFVVFSVFDRPRKPSSHSLDSQDDDRLVSPSKHGHPRTSSSPDRTGELSNTHFRQACPSRAEPNRLGATLSRPK